MKYRSQLVPFGELVMARVPIKPAGLRKKLNTQWVKGAWVGRMERNDAHIVLLEQGIVTARTTRRLIEQNRFDRKLISKLKGVTLFL